MADPVRYALLHGPYRPPRKRTGSKVFCEIRGTVTIGGFLDGPIPWPWVKKPGSRSAVLCGDLVKAVRRESELAVAHHFGVCKNTVKAWRRTLGVPRVTEGTHRLTSAIAEARTDDRLERARRNSKRPAALAKASAKLKGRVPHPNSLDGLRRAAGRPRSDAWKA
jgi:hypothetical protein